MNLVEYIFQMIVAAAAELEGFVLKGRKSGRRLWKRDSLVRRRPNQRNAVRSSSAEAAPNVLQNDFVNGVRTKLEPTIWTAAKTRYGWTLHEVLASLFVD